MVLSYEEKTKIKEIIILGVNEKFKQAKSFDDLQKIISIMQELQNCDIHLSFIMKKTGYEALDFKPYSIGFGNIGYTSKDRVTYIVDDGISVRESLVKNLSRNIDIKE